MGTKIEYSINPLAYSKDCNNFTVVGVDAWEHYQNKVLKVSNKHCSIGVDNLQNPMDRILDRNNMESIRKTMQIQEDIFKNQVSCQCSMLYLAKFSCYPMKHGHFSDYVCLDVGHRHGTDTKLHDFVKLLIVSVFMSCLVSVSISVLHNLILNKDKIQVSIQFVP